VTTASSRATINAVDYYTAAFAGTQLADLDRVAVVQRLTVHPGYRGRGQARALLSEMSRKINNTGKTPVAVITADNQASRQLFASCGWLLANRYIGNAGVAMTTYFLPYR